MGGYFFSYEICTKFAFEERFLLFLDRSMKKENILINFKYLNLSTYFNNLDVHHTLIIFSTFRDKRYNFKRMKEIKDVIMCYLNTL